MFFLALLIGTIGVFILGIIVFGGGQVFMPLFSSLWQILQNNYGSKISSDVIQNVFTIVNSTPGVVSTKLAAITGLLIANGEWWGWLAIFLTYAVFILPAILLMYWANRLFVRLQKSNFIKYLKWFKPVIIGILGSLAIQLLLGIIMPQYSFNYSYTEYIHHNVNTERVNFFKSWRFYVLLFWVPFVIGLTIWLRKKNVNILVIILGAIALSLVVFQPWLAKIFF